MGDRRKRSGPPSLTNSQQRLDGHTFLVEASLGKGVTRALAAAGLRVVEHTDVLSGGVADPVWINYAAEHGAIMLTKDKDVITNPPIREAVMRTGGRCFTLARGDLNGAQMEAAFVAGMKNMARMLEKLTPPFVVSIGSKGDITSVQPTALLGRLNKKDPAIARLTKRGRERLS